MASYATLLLSMAWRCLWTVRAVARLLVASEPVGEERITQAAAAPSRDLRARSGGEEKSHEEKWSPPQRSVNEVFVKSLEGKLLLFSCTEEDTVLDLRNRVAMACKVSVHQFVLVFQSRTLQCSVEVESTGVQRGHTFYMQGPLNGRMQRQGLMGEWDCRQRGATRVWLARTSCFNELLDLHADLQLQAPIQPPPMPNGPVPVGQEMPPEAPDLPETMADDLDMTPRGHVNEEDREEITAGANKKIRVCAPQDEDDVESLVTGLPKDLLLFVLSRGQEIMAEREKIQSCHNIDDLLQGGLDG